MTVTAVVIFGIFIALTAIILVLNIGLSEPRQRNRYRRNYEHQDLIDSIHSRIAKSNGATIEHFSLENQQVTDFYKDAEFINKDCKTVEEFIINDDITAFDLRKLADLNGISLQISPAWYPMTLELIKELNANGWDKKVTCIKEKYASLRFYTHCEYGDNIHKIIDGYEYKSQTVCETCGEKGEIRHNSGWDYVACRKHYLENRGKITVDSKGFNHNGTYYHWDEIKERSFEDPDHYGRYRFLLIELNKSIVKHAGWSDNKLYISKNTIGFGNLLSHLSKNFYSSAHSYIRKFEEVAFCEICGYQAVYNEECECCENETWQGYLENWKSEENTAEKKHEHIKFRQIDWASDDGERCESEQKNYIKNPDHKILFNDDDLKEYLEY
ncbi:hypothetical protein [Flavobacterium pedocola]